MDPLATRVPFGCRSPRNWGPYSTPIHIYVQLGTRIANARRAAGITQVQLAEALGVAQQTLAHYEGGKLRIAVALLPHVSQQLGISVEQLIGVPVPSAKRGPQPRLLQQVERIQRLPRPQQRFVMQMIDTALQASTTQAAE
jgi:transcriptional regulator with XRE-family HTH domain